MITTKIKVKYGLPHEPTDSELASWRLRVLAYRNQGVPEEDAGHRAANETFRGCGTVKYASQADTIESLLEEIRKKSK